MQQRRGARLARLRAGGEGGGAAWLWSLLRRGWARAGYAVADHSRSALILAVFAFKVRDGGSGIGKAETRDGKVETPAQRASASTLLHLSPGRRCTQLLAGLFSSPASDFSSTELLK